MSFKLPMALVLLMVLPWAAEAQSAAAWRLAEAIGVGVGTGIIGNYAYDHLKTYAATWGASGTPEGHFKEGLEQWHAGNKVAALESIKKSADSEYSPAQLFLGDVALHDMNYSEARVWYSKAAKHDESWAEFQMGNLASEGRLGSADDREAIYWYRLAADRHFSPAEFNLAQLLLTSGAAVSEQAEAVARLRDAATQGMGEAQAYLGYLYAVGKGTGGINHCEALKWNQMAAAKKIPIALNNLAVAFENGECTGAADRMQALAYFREAAMLGNDFAKNNLARLEPQIKAELASLAAAASSQPKECSLLTPKFYDLSAVETANSGRNLKLSFYKTFSVLIPPNDQVWAYAEGQDAVMVSYSSVMCSTPGYPCVFVSKRNISCTNRTFGDLMNSIGKQSIKK